MEQHVKAVGVANIAYGLAGGFVCLLLVVFMGLGDIYSRADASAGMGPVVGVYVLYHLGIALPMAATGAGLLRYSENARLAGVVLSAINLLNMPFGSVLGMYGLWVLLSPETEPLFLDPVLKRVRTQHPPGPASGARKTSDSGSRGRHLYSPAVKPVRTNLPE